MKYRQLYEIGKKRLEDENISEATLDARILLEHICHTNRNDLYAHGDREVDENTCETYISLVEKRQQHVPLQYILGQQEFMGLTFLVNEKVLIPRQDTEILVEEVLKNLHDGMRILDMCTGSGCILTSLLHYSNHCIGVGADISEDALKLAEENANNILDREVQIQFIQSNLFSSVAGKYDIIVSNPPYIKTEEIGYLMKEVGEQEPFIALDGGVDGLDFYRQITKESRAFLNRGGMLFFEIGCEQAADVSQIMENNGFVEIESKKDYAGLDRIVFGTCIE